MAANSPTEIGARKTRVHSLSIGPFQNHFSSPYAPIEAHTMPYSTKTTKKPARRLTITLSAEASRLADEMRRFWGTPTNREFFERLTREEARRAERDYGFVPERSLKQA